MTDENERGKEKGSWEKKITNDKGNIVKKRHTAHMKIEWNVFSLFLVFFLNKKPVACAHPHSHIYVCIEYRFAIGILYFCCFFLYKSQSINIERSKANGCNVCEEKSLIARHADVYTDLWMKLSKKHQNEMKWNKKKNRKRDDGKTASKAAAAALPASYHIARTSTARRNERNAFLYVEKGENWQKSNNISSSNNESQSQTKSHRLEI